MSKAGFITLDCSRNLKISFAASRTISTALPQAFRRIALMHWSGRTLSCSAVKTATTGSRPCSALGFVGEDHHESYNRDPSGD
jgi:hypothetical protein